MNRNDGDGRKGSGKGNYGRLMPTRKILPVKSSNRKSSRRGKITDKKKTVPKGKHHTVAKPIKQSYSIRERVAAALGAAAGGKKKSLSSRAKAGDAGRGTKSFKTDIIRNKHRKATRDKRKSNYQMSLPGNSNSIHHRNRDSFTNIDTINANDPVPWFEAELQERFCFRNKTEITGAEAASSTATKASSAAISNTTPKAFSTFPPEHILQFIDDELHSFSAYVRLTHTERVAREFFLDHVAEQADIALLAIPTSFRNRHNGEISQRVGKSGEKIPVQERVRVVPFGSFATQEVCCFASDVDVCLWGVVGCESEEAQKKSTTTRHMGEDVFEGDEGGCSDTESEVEINGNDVYPDECGSDNDDDERRILSRRSCLSLQGIVDNGCPTLTESSLLRTMDAIQSASTTVAATSSCDANGGFTLFTATLPRKGTETSTCSNVPGTKQKQQQSQQQSQPPPSNPSESNFTNGGNLFFIDRLGESTEPIDSKCVDSSDQLKIDHVSLSNTAVGSTIEELSENHNVCEGAKESASTRDVMSARDAKNSASSLEGMYSDKNTEDLKESRGCNDGEEVIDLTNSDDGKDIAMETCDRRAKVEKRRNTQNGSQKDVKGGHEVLTRIGYSSEDSVVEINDDDDSDDNTSKVALSKIVDNHNRDDDESDSADKMSAYYRRRHSLFGIQCSRNIKPPDESSPSIQFKDSSDHRSSKIEIMELSLTSNFNNNGLNESKTVQPIKHAMGPTGKTRIQVISALMSLTRQLRMCNFTHTIECRKSARVPIINCSTRMGFEGDIAIGGHNGVDTSMYATSQVKRFKSFAPIVLLLKIVLAQQGLDKPFTGGLGSYRLYVLAAYAIERHLADGGNDRPSEVLFSLLARYGRIKSHNIGKQSTMTDLERLHKKKVTISCGGGICDLELVFRISDCIDMFRECHMRLLTRISMTEEIIDKEKNGKISILSSIIDCYRLRDARETSDRRSKMCDTAIGRTAPIARNDPGKVNNGRKIGKVFSKSDGPEEWIVRGPRGNIIPKTRPDLKAKNSNNSNRNLELLQRSTKNRKNNKKQKRDVALKEFAFGQLNG